MGSGYGGSGSVGGGSGSSSRGLLRISDGDGGGGHGVVVDHGSNGAYMTVPGLLQSGGSEGGNGGSGVSRTMIMEVVIMGMVAMDLPLVTIGDGDGVCGDGNFGFDDDMNQGNQ